MKRDVVLLLAILLICLSFNLLLTSHISSSSSIAYADSFKTLLQQPKELTVEEAQQIILNRFDAYGIEEINYLGRFKGKFDTYNFEVIFEGGEKAVIQVTVVGGNILTISGFDPKFSKDIEQDECALRVQDFVQELGFKDLSAVWFSRENSEIVVNLAPIIEDVVIYTDMIKAKANCISNELMNLEARRYLTKPSERSKELLTPALEANRAQQIISKDFEVLESRLVLIPEEDGEKLAYEFKSKLKGLDYYIYVDADTGEQLNIIPALGGTPISEIL